MSNVDERVVSLEFDNSKFERNTQQSIKTLNDLDSSIERAGAARGLENLGRSANNIDMTGLANNVEQVSNRFSTMGIVGMTAIQNITTGVMNLGKKALGQIVSGGMKRALNIEHAKFQIQGLKGVWDETSKGYVEGMKTIKEAVNNAVKGTAYGLDEAAKIGSQLMASGYKDADVLEKHLLSVSGLAAMTGGSYEEIGNIFAKVAGQGRLMAQDLLSISSRGINAAATLKDYLNNNKKVADEAIKQGKLYGKSAKTIEGVEAKLKKGLKLTEGDIRDLVSQSAISFDIFSSAMNDAFAEHAKEANKTFTGALANMKAALSRIGAEFASPGLEKFRDIFNSLTPLIDAAHTSMMPFVEVVVKGMTNSTKAVTKFMDSLLIFNKAGEFVGWANAEQIAKRLTKTLGGQTARNVADTWSGIVSIFNILKRVLAYVFNTTSGVFGSIGKLILSVTGFIGRLITGLDKTIEKTTGLGGVIKSIGSILSGVFGVIRSIVDFLTTGISSLGVLDAQRLSKVGDSMSKTASVAERAGQIISNVFGHISDVISGAMNAISKAASGGQFNELIQFFSSGTLVFIGTQLAMLLRRLAFFTSNIKNTVGILGNVGYAINRFSHLVQARSLREVAIATLLLAGALLLLSKVDTDRVASSLTVLGGAIAEFTTMFMVLTKLSSSVKLFQTFQIISLSKAVIYLAAGLLVLSLAVKILASLSWDQVIRGLVGLTGILVVTIALTNQLDKMGYKLIGSSTALVILGLALLNLAKVVKVLGSLDTKSLIKGLVSISILLVGISKFLNNSSSYELSIKTAIALLVTSEALSILANAISKLGKLNVSQLITSLAGLGMALLEIQAIMNMLSETESKMKTAFSIGVIAIALNILASALEKIGSMSWSGIAKSLIAFAAAFAIVIGLVKSFEKIGIKSAFSILIISGAFTVLSTAIQRLGTLPLKAIGKALLALGGALLVFGGVSSLLSVAAGAMMKLGVALVLIGTGLAAAGAGMFLFATGLTLLVTSGEAILASIPTFVTALIQGLKQFLAEAVSLIPYMANLGIQLVIALLKGLRDSIPIMIDIIADIIVEVFDGLATRIPEIATAGTKFVKALSVEVIDLLSASLLKIAAAAFILKQVNIRGAIKAVAALFIFANGLALVMAEFGALNKIPGIKEFLNGGAELLATLGHAIGLFIGSFVGGIGEGVTASMPKMAKSLSKFMENLKPFLEGAKGINPDIGSGIKSVAAAILYLTGAKLLDSLAVFAGSNTFEEFGTQLNKFAPGFKQFANSMKDVDDTSIDKIKSVGSAIKTLAQTAAEIPNTGGIVSVFTGDNQLSDFTKQFAKVSVNLNTMVMGLSAIPKGGLTKIKNAGEAIKVMVEVANEIPNTGGLVSVFTGDNTLSAFADELASFGEPLATFADSVSGVKSWEGVKNAGEAMKSINEFANNIPNSGGLIAKIVGDNNLSDFGKQLAGFIPSLKEFVNSASGIKTDNVEKVKSIIPIMKAMGDVVKAMPNTGGLVQDFTGSSILTDENFGPNIKKFGKAVAATAEAFVGIKDTSSIEAAIPLIDAFKRLMSNLPETGGFFSIFTGDEDLETWSTQLKSFGTGIKDFMTELAGITFDNITGLPQLITSLAKIAESSDSFDSANFQKISDAIGSEEGGSAFGKAIKSFSDEIADVKSDNLPAVSKLINSLANFGKKAGKTSFSGLSDLMNRLPKLGTNLGKFSTNLGEFNGDSAKEAAGVVKTLSSITDSFTQFTTTTRKGNSTSASFDTKTFESFTSALGDIAKEVKTFAEDMQKVKTDGLAEKAEEIKTFINSVTSAINKASKNLKKKGKQGINAFLQGFTNVGATKVDSSKISNVVIKSLGSPNFAQYNKAGVSAAAKYVSGLTKELSKAKTAGNDIFDKVKAGANQSLTQTGKDVGQGFVNGILYKTDEAYDAGAELYKQAKQAIKDKGKVNSPAKDMMPVGSSISEGLVVGMLKYKDEVYSTGEKVATYAMNGVKDNYGTDFTNPVIKPVLDLSDVKSGANSIGGMFGTTSINPQLVPQIQNRQNGASETEMFKEAVDKMSNTIVQSQQTNNSPTYNIGDVTLKVDDLKDVLTLDQFVAVVKKAKAFS